MGADVTQLASKIRLLLMDVDGVLTDGKLYNVPGPDGKMVETKGFDSQDGIGLQWLARVGITTGVISGRLSPATAERARQCKMKYVYQGHTEKIPILEEILADAKLDPERSGVHRRRSHGCGGDAARGPGHRHRPTRGRRSRPSRTTSRSDAGGQGAVREVVELLLKAQDRWPEILKHYEVSE